MRNCKIIFFVKQFLLMKKITFILAFITSTFAFAQSVSVSGSVVDSGDSSDPIAFATVKVKGLDISTETDLEGNYELNLLQGEYVLMIDFIGYDPIELNHVSVQNEKVILDPVVLKTLRPSFDLATIDEE